MLLQRGMKNPENMTTEELIELADRIKGNMTTEWLKRYNKRVR